MIERESDQLSLISYGASGQSNLNDHSPKVAKDVTGRETVPEKAYDLGLTLAGKHTWYDNWRDEMLEKGIDKVTTEAVFDALLWDCKIVEPILGKIEVIE